MLNTAKRTLHLKLGHFLAKLNLVGTVSEDCKISLRPLLCDCEFQLNVEAISRMIVSTFPELILTHAGLCWPGNDDDDDGT